jgi:hypothetical protein
MYQVYPRTLLRTKLRPKPNQCFVLMPFHSSFDEVYAEIKSSLKTIGFGCSRADDIYENRPIMTIILSEIAVAHFVIADLTGKNPNVFYEVGVAHSLRDIPNVILISQSMDHVPFDLRHLPVIIYEHDNMRGLTTRLVKKIIENKDLFEGKIRVQERYQQQIGTEADFEELFLFLEEEERILWKLILHTLDISADPMSESDIIYGLFHMRAQLSGLAASGKLRLFRNTFKIFKDMLARFVELRQIEDYVSDVLSRQRFPDFSVDDADANDMLIDLAIALFRHPKFKKRALEWLFGYLSKPKVAGIDISRSKVEHFVLYSDDIATKEALIYTLDNPNAYMRETVADFIGEMRLEGAVRNLLFALAKETSPFAARSMFSALGKIGKAEGAKGILEWVRGHLETAMNPNMGYGISYARKAAEAIDRNNGTRFEEELSLIVQSE